MTIVAALILFSGLALVTSVPPSGGQEGSPARLLGSTCEGSEEQPESNLFELPLEGGEGTLIGEITGDEVVCTGDLAWGNDTLWAVDINSQWIYTIPLDGGEVTPIVQVTNIGTPCGLAYNPADDSLWVIDYDAGGLFTVPTDGGPAVLIDFTGIDTPCGLGYDPVADLLYTVERDEGVIHSLDPATADGDELGDGILTGCGADFDTGESRFLATNDGEESNLFEGALEDGETSVDLGETGFDYVCGLAYIPAVAPATTTTTAAPITPAPAQPAAAVALTPSFTG
jgi:DNA-binding beta-propeller fold protein YncE